MHILRFPQYQSTGPKISGNRRHIDSQEVTARILEGAKRRGASFCETRIAHGAHSLKRIVENRVYQPTAGEGISISFGFVVGGKRIVMGCDSLAILERQMDDAFLIARYLPEDVGVYTPETAHPPASLPRELLYDSETAELDDRRLIEIVKRVNAVMEPFLFEGRVSHSYHEISYANSVGTYQSSPVTSAQLVVFGFEPTDRFISAYNTVAGKSFAQFPVEELARRVVEKLTMHRDYLARHGGRRINLFEGKSGPQEFPVILEPSCWSGMLTVFSDAWNGKEFQEGKSFFSGKLGGRVMDEKITIWDDPLHPEGIPDPFDGEGHPRQKLLLVEKGIARNVAYDGALAKEYGVISTGHALPFEWRHHGARPGNLVMEGGNSSIEDMIRDSLEPTVLVTTLHYIRQTHQQDGRETGCTIHGAFLVEHGEIVGPVEDMRFDESIPGSLERVTHLGPSRPSLSMENDETPFIVPATRLERFRFVSVAERNV